METDVYMRLAIVPAYNEEKQIGSVVRSLFDHVDEVVVVDDCSRDRTAQQAKEAGATVILHTINRGQGAALQTGHAYAQQRGAQYVIHFDGDGQLDVADIAPALETMQKHDADILFGARIHDAQAKIPWTKKYIIHPLAKIFDYFFGGKLKLSDSHNGFRIIHGRALDTVVITQDRMAHASEIPAIVAREGLRYVEHPVRITYHEYGQRFSGGLRVVKDIIFGKFIS